VLLVESAPPVVELVASEAAPITFRVISALVVAPYSSARVTVKVYEPAVVAAPAAILKVPELKVVNSDAVPSEAVWVTEAPSGSVLSGTV
jgi:hypothetical protein